MIQLPVILFFLTDEKTIILPLERAVHSLYLVFLLTEVLASLWALRKMTRKLTLLFHLRQFGRVDSLRHAGVNPVLELPYHSVLPLSPRNDGHCLSWRAAMDLYCKVHRWRQLCFVIFLFILVFEVLNEDVWFFLNWRKATTASWILLINETDSLNWNRANMCYFEKWPHGGSHGPEKGSTVTVRPVIHVCLHKTLFFCYF